MGAWPALGLSLLALATAPAAAEAKTGAYGTVAGSVHGLMDRAYPMVASWEPGIALHIIMGETMAGSSRLSRDQWTLSFRNESHEWKLQYYDGELHDPCKDLRVLVANCTMATQTRTGNTRGEPSGDGCLPIDIVFLDTHRIQAKLEEVRFPKTTEGTRYMAVLRPGGKSCLRNHFMHYLGTDSDFPGKLYRKTIWMSHDGQGNLIVLDAETGKVLWRRE